MTTPKGIKIISDGTVMGTRVFTEDGEDVTRKLQIKQVEWRHSVSEAPEARLTCVLAAIEATVQPPGPPYEDISNLASQYREWRKK